LKCQTSKWRDWGQVARGGGAAEAEIAGLQTRISDDTGFAGPATFMLPSLWRIPPQDAVRLGGGADDAIDELVAMV
jgi:hypothetical protein